MKYFYKIVKGGGLQIGSGFEIPKGFTEYKRNEEPQELKEARVYKTPEEVNNEAKTKGEVYTLNGVDYQVPFMKDDADALMQVNAAFSLGVTDTVIYFTNGTEMPITAAEFRDFVVWFVTKRNAFFTLG